MAEDLPKTVDILCVDDDPRLLELTQSRLESLNDAFETTAAQDVASGLEQLAAGEFDCIVSDHMMPGQTGLEFLRTVREENPDIPFILLTGQGSEHVASDAISAGVTDYFEKDAAATRFELLADRIASEVSARVSKRLAADRRQQLQQTMKTVPTAVTRVNRDGEIVYANERARVDLGFEPSEVTDRTYNNPDWQIRDLDGEPLPDDELPFQQVMQSGEPIRGFQHTIVWPDGTRRIVEINGSPLFDTSGDVESVVFAIADITGHIERERQLQAERDRLDEFAGLVSHDLRNPLEAARTNLEMAAIESDSPLLEDVDQALERMDVLIDDLLALARGNDVVENTTLLDLGQFAEECWRSVDTGTATLEAEATGSVRGDSQQLARAFENLFRNAVEHGGDDITVRVGDIPGQDGFYVADDGEGMPDAEQARVFESGFSTRPDGTGLGLAIVEEVVQAHGWTIDLTNSASGGARFEITDG
jgi:PAS domain S-box-containing protein